VSIPTKEELTKLHKAEGESDDEVFHAEFDDLLEKKLMELDPEWMKFMEEFYGKSGLSRWCA